MRRYTAAPKEIAEALRHSVPVSEEDAIGDGWKDLPYGSAEPSKRKKKASSDRKRKSAVSKEIVYRAPSSRRGKAKSFYRLKVGDLRVEVPGNGTEAYTEELIELLKKFLKTHPVKA